MPHAIYKAINKIQTHNLSPLEIGLLEDRETMNSYKFRCHKHQSRVVREMTNKEK